MALLEEMKKLRYLLEKNSMVKKIYFVEDHKKNILEMPEFSSFDFKDYVEIYSCFKKNIKYLNQYFLMEKEEKIKLVVEKIDECLEDNIENNFDDVFCENLIAVQNMLVIYCVTAMREKKFEDNLLDKKSIGKYYRGESDFSYKLLPSIYRNYEVKSYGSTINYSILGRLYYDCGLIDKYYKIFKSKVIDYEFCSFMQHSKAYSPFIDLTENINIALSFATHNTGGINKYLTTEGAIYEFEFKNNIFSTTMEENTVSIRDIDIFVVEGRLHISAIVRKKILCKCTFEDFNIEKHVFVQQGNDRMKYQNGAFLYLNRCVIVNGILLMPISEGTITKYKIPVEKKKQIYKHICETQKYYDFDHLMDPYKYFDESPF